MKKTTILTFVICLALVISLTVPVTKSGYTSAQQDGAKKVKQLTPEKIKELQARSEVVERVRKMLLSRQVPFDPYLLFTKNWQTKLSTAFDQMPEMYENRNVPLTRIKGVGIANELTLPARITLTGHTVILARKVKFEGRDVLIKGPYDLHIFAVESMEAKISGGSITIDLSGPGRKEWLESQKNPRPALPRETEPVFFNASYTPISSLAQNQSGQPGANGANGQHGSNGANGANGAAGSNGSCSGGVNGANGSGGVTGSDGSGGGDGGNGGNGANGSAMTVTITNPNDSTPYNLITRGGAGGKGGDGGYGGAGGTGGDGGKGGNGASCSCNPGGVGNGGNGGNGGRGGDGGYGGDGGDGGDGGNGGSITVNFVFGYNTSQIAYDNSGGAAGEAGQAGLFGQPGQPGAPGGAGSAGSLIGCEGTQGAAGSTGASGDPGSGGSGGSGGNGGSSGGSPTYNMTGGSTGGGGGGGGYEPGGWGGGCTEWYWVWYECIPLNDRQDPLFPRKKVNFLKTSFRPGSNWCLLTEYQCYEVDRWYAGCW